MLVHVPQIYASSFTSIALRNLLGVCSVHFRLLRSVFQILYVSNTSLLLDSGLLKLEASVYLASINFWLNLKLQYPGFNTFNTPK